MKLYFSLLGMLLLTVSFSGCSPSTPKQSKDEQYLQQQEQQQGYPVLIAAPEVANYGLPFCEKKYCLEVEIFSFHSQDLWFNQYVDQKIADLMRKQLGLSQKLSLQQAVNEFVRLSDAGSEKNQQPWSVMITPRVPMQQNEIVVLQLETEYVLDDQVVAPQQFYDVIDRKTHQSIRLYDIIQPAQRIVFGAYLQSQYQHWLTQQQLDKTQFPDKLYWANQDWFFDEEGIGIYYRAKSLNAKTAAENLTIYLSTTQSQTWLKKEYFNKILLNK